jgi:hypothetical protein
MFMRLLERALDHGPGQRAPIGGADVAVPSLRSFIALPAIDFVTGRCNLGTGWKTKQVLLTGRYAKPTHCVHSVRAASPL